MERTANFIKTSEIEINSEPYIFPTALGGLYLIRRPVYKDPRGSFQEIERIPDLEAVLGREVRFLQTQISASKPGVIRGIHVEPQDKLVTPLTGIMCAVIVDVRPDSPTFRNWLMFEFDNTSLDTPRTSLFIPRGMGNSICVPNESPQDVLYFYKVSTVYDPASSGRGINYKDPELNIPWPVENPIVSEKRDATLPSLAEFLEMYGYT
jgi:dTDP-4-dehydrorhamnose 3,5-epimerase